MDKGNFLTSVKRKRKNISYSKYGYFFVAPFLIFFVVFSFSPLLYTFLMSFSDKVGIVDGMGKFNGLNNYIYVVKDAIFWRSILTTIKIWGLNAVLQFGLALFLAAVFNSVSLKLKGQGIFKVFFYIPNIVTAATVGLLFRQMLTSEGLFNIIMGKLNSGWVNKEFLYDEKVVQTSVSILLTWIWYGNTMIVLLAGMAGINPTLYEAARIDGAGGVRQFVSITIPLLKTILLYTFVTSLAGGLQMYDVPFFFTPQSHTRTVLIKLYQWGFTSPYNHGFAAAGSIIMLFITMIISSAVFFIMRDSSSDRKHSPKAL